MSFDKPVVEAFDGEGLRFLIVAARYNEKLVDALLQRVVARLREARVEESDIDVLRVPGSNETPYAIQLGLDTGGYDCALALGVLVRGETIHYSVIARSVSDALQMVALNHQAPVINGVIVAENLDQARERAAGRLDRGRELAESALVMAALRREREARNVQQ